jgi:hypothetical protein
MSVVLFEFSQRSVLRYYRSAVPSLWEDNMDSTTLLIIIIVVLLIGGGGWYGRGRWF